MTTEVKKELIRTLIITDGIFHNQCKDSVEYLERLKTVLGKNQTQEFELYSVPGTHGVSGVDKTIPEIEMDMKNKTTFVQSLQNVTHLFDALLVIRDVDDNFVAGAKQLVTEMCKPLYTYGYQRKTK